jgi:hypothetical protein
MSFDQIFAPLIEEFKNILQGDSKQWNIKGFIDTNHTIYPISVDTKVVSKIIELMIFPKILQFAEKNNFEIKLTPYQNYYPDVTLIDKSNGEKHAIDIKSTYRVNAKNVNGMTLGAFTGYFRSRDSTKNITYPYKEYKKHWILGFIYTRTDLFEAESILENYEIRMTNDLRKQLSAYLLENTDENWEKLCEIKEILPELRAFIDNCISDELKTFAIEDIETIPSVVRDFDVFFVEKWKIASDKAGSGNTKNIGSVKEINLMISGRGIFTEQENGYEVFDKYWQEFETIEMAKANGRDKRKYTDLKSFYEWRSHL